MGFLQMRGYSTEAAAAVDYAAAEEAEKLGWLTLQLPPLFLLLSHFFFPPFHIVVMVLAFSFLPSPSIGKILLRHSPRFLPFSAGLQPYLDYLFCREKK